ncbi:MAG: DUF58 domain-containing protein [Victivallaceae bacterium]|nr:DUF58 domain-containing protein [Victivallaceae bacterium]
MIIPRNIIGWSLLLLPFSAIALMGDSFMQVWLLMLAVLVLVALFDAVSLLRHATGIAVKAPESSGLYLKRSGSFELTFFNPDHQSRLISNLRLMLPPEISYEMHAEDILLPASEQSVIDVECLPHRRGSYQVGECIFEVKSPLGGWSMRVRKQLDAELRVYPDLPGERKKLAALFLNSGLSGMHINRLLGQGREFEKLREYLPGDGFDIISWKATAKRGRPISKVYQMEDTQEVYAIFDTSRFSRVTKNDTTNLDHYLASSFTLSQIAERQKDSFGLIGFDSQIRSFIRAGNGQAHHLACRDEIFSLMPQDNSPDFNNLFTFIRMKLRRRAMLIFLTDLSDPALAEEFIHGVELLANRHLCFINMLNNDEIIPLFKNPVETGKEVYNRLAGHLKWSDLQETRLELARHGISLSLTDRSGLSLQMVSEYLEAKRRQMI